MADDKPKPLVTRLFQACLLLLGAVIALRLAVMVLAQFWGWLLLAVAVALLILAAIYGIRWWRDRQW